MKMYPPTNADSYDIYDIHYLYDFYEI